MADPMYAIRRAMYVKIEGAYGTDAAPAAGDVVLMRSVNPQPLVQDFVERTLVRGYFGRFARLPIGGRVVIECEMEMAGFGVAGPAIPTPGYDSLLRICALSRTITADTKVDYAPVTPGTDSATIYFYEDGRLHKAFGARGTVRMRMQRNNIPVYAFTITGLYGGVTDVAFPAVDTSAYVEPKPVVAGNVTAFSFMGIPTLCLESLEIDLGNSVEYRNLPNCGEAIRVIQRSASASIEIEGTKVAVYNWWDAVKNATKGALSIAHGTDAGNIIQLSSPNVQLTEPRETENQGIVHQQFSLDLLPTSVGNNELLLSIR
ncbi:phage tail tube protein [Hydrocarboniphaga effusa]|uniref:phage tail tube protein n=1 Tax=Hydrocarboniphaga effusa TaxID=243629 RepID=UPI003BA84C12